MKRGMDMMRSGPSMSKMGAKFGKLGGGADMAHGKMAAAGAKPKAANLRQMPAKPTHSLDGQLGQAKSVLKMENPQQWDDLGPHH